MKAYPNKLQAVFNAIEDFLVVLDDQGRIVEVNPTVTKRLGYTRDELVGESVLLLHPPDRQAEVAAILTDVISGKRDDCRLPLLTKDQKSIPVETKFSRTKWGKQAALIGISRDITEYKRVEEVLSVYREHLEEVVQERTKALESEIIERKRVEEQLAFQLDLLGNITDAVLATDENFIIQFWNSAAERMYGWKAEEVWGRHTVEVLDPEYLNHTRDEVIRIVHETGVVHWETLQSRKDGTRIPVEGKTVVLRDAEGHIFGYATANRDITERKQAEDELRQSEEKYRQLFEVESDALFMLNGETAAIIEANLAAVELYQYRRDELLTMNAIQLTAEPDKSRKRLHNPIGNIPLRYHRKKDGTIFPVEILYSDFDYHGQPMRIATVRDITARLQAEERLRESEQRFSAAFYNNGVALAITTMEGRWVEVNQAFCALLGYSREEVIGRTSAELGIVNTKVRQDILEAERSSGSIQNSEVAVRARHGQVHTILVSAEPISLNGVPHRITTNVDISERKQVEESLCQSNRSLEKALADLRETQEQMLHQERLAAVGQLAAGIAHDFNNILTSILGFAELLQQAPDTPETMQPDLQRISASSQRAAYLVRQLLDFSRKTIRHPKRFELDALLKESTAFFGRAIPENIEIRLSIAPGQYMIEADATQLQQVITNLAVNARDAMPTGGKLDMSLSRLETSGEEICAVCSRPIIGKWLGLSVTDNGSGVPAEALPRMFDPFFTTKEVGKGTGLGLAQVAGIVEEHGGHISVNSRVERGITFTVYLPPASRQGDRPPEETPPMVQSGQGQTVLLVEDELHVVDTITAMLEHLHYRVITAANGREALAVYREQRADIALVLSDMVMPDMDGETLFHALTAETPDLKMVLMSGYPLGEKGADLLTQGIVAWLEKPFTFGQLSQVVDKVLSNKTESWG